MSRESKSLDEQSRLLEREAFEYILAEGDRETIAGFLRTALFDLTLGASERKAIADAIVPPKRERGRPRGALGKKKSERTKAIQIIVEVVRGLEAKWFANHSGANAIPMRVRQKVIEEVFSAPEFAFFHFPTEITKEEINYELRRGGSSRKNKK